MNILENVAYGLMVRGVDRARREKRAEAMLEMVQLPEIGARKPAQLSGGQRQRIALARALAVEPRVLLLDEPFGALDAITRANLQREFARLVRELGKTAVFVTHDLHEAMLLATRIALMDKGHIVLLDTPDAFRRSDIPLVRAYLDTVLLPA